MKSKLLTGLALSCAVAGLSACGSSATPPAEATASSALAVANARLMLAPVKGNPAAAYFDLTNKGSKEWMLTGASLAGSQSSTLHTTDEKGGSMEEMPQVPVKPGETVHFEPGHLHVMVMDPPADLAPGGKSQLTLKFLGGDTMSFPVEAKPAGAER